MTQSSTNLNFGKQLIFATIAGSSFIAAATYEVNSNPMPSMNVTYTECITTYPWEAELGISNLAVNDYQDYDTMVNFAKKVVSETKDIDIDIQEAVNKIFWDLL